MRDFRGFGRFWIFEDFEGFVRDFELFVEIDLWGRCEGCWKGDLGKKFSEIL